MIFSKILKIGGVTSISRMLGLVRDITIALTLGASSFSDAFFIAFKIPNIFRRLFAEGTLNTIFVPLLSNILKDKGKKEGAKFANEVFTILFLGLMFLIIIMEIFMPKILLVTAPGIKQKSLSDFSLVVTLTRITLPYLFFISLATLFASISNTLKKFTVVAGMPLILNLSIIAFMVFSQKYNSPCISAYFAASSISFAGIIQFILIFWYVKNLKWKVKLVKIKSISSDVKTFLKRVLPVIVTAGIYQINIFIDITIASLLASGSISYLYYGDRLNQLPLAIIGIAIGTVITPFIASASSKEHSNHIKTDAFLYGIFLSLPAVIGFIVFGKEIITMLFNYGQFDYYSVEKTYLVLIAYSIGLLPNILIKIIVSIFYAESKVFAPFIINLSMLILNIILALTLSYFVGVWGVALATSITSIVSFSLLFFLLIKRKLLHISKEFKIEVLKGLLLNTIICSILIVSKYGWVYLVSLYNHRWFFSVSLMLYIVLIVSIYIIGCKIFKSKIYTDFALMFKKKL